MLASRGERRFAVAKVRVFSESHKLFPQKMHETGSRRAIFVIGISTNFQINSLKM